MEEEEKNSKANSCISFNRRFSVAEKLKVIKYAKENTLHAASNLYGISRQAIRFWIREKKELMKITNKMSTITLHQGKSSKTISYQSEILDYVYYNRALKNAVTSNEIIFKLWRIEEKYREKSWSSYQKWWYSQRWIYHGFSDQKNRYVTRFLIWFFNILFKLKQKWFYYEINT